MTATPPRHSPPTPTPTPAPVSTPAHAAGRVRYAPHPHRARPALLAGEDEAAFDPHVIRGID
ncbi:hypothetical protein [Streptomyces sp. NPDC004284]|uniref:hypothetical protein n=1 Tax=Streptomyces sp. NPDC004284 TaxID=3364695 RepID=UPI0036A7346D